ncbi:S8 family peptidase [Flavihumibacter profundi]|uniref:S8 family peptidase n=1 Tax=Flavihumibacter profundi TaxID=2716883 RepID=UPI001CC687F8|nr:S8 family peptidase [Flavihumibacter profundi]MBZ5859090.1 S8 family peptidase [Flavihumibacter profundi]
MAERNLPIKFFQKRQKDELDTEGGGERRLPKWVNTPSELQEKVSYVSNVLTNISRSLAEKVNQNNYVPSVVKVKLNEEALAKSHRKEIATLFNIGKINMIGIAGEDEVLVKIDSQNDVLSILKKFENINDAFPSFSTTVGVSAITNVEEFKPVIDVEPDKETVLKLKLINYENNELNSIVTKQFESYCDDKKLRYERAAYSGDLNIYRLSDVTQDAFEELKNFDGVQLISEMPVYDITLDEIMEEKQIPVKVPKEGVNYPVVGVLDTGVADIPHLKPWLHKNSFSKYHTNDVDKSHGTFVAGVLIYGDELEGQGYTGVEGCKIFEAIVMPDIKKQRIYEDELIEHIREAIGKNDEIKIWNLSLGTSMEADHHEFSDFAKALDEIQEHHDVLICKSAGNCDAFTRSAPTKRISKSADTVRGLVVGSLTHDKNGTDISDKHTPSPFSRKGPGPAYLIKPDVVHIGGNAGLDHRNNPVYNHVYSFAPDGRVAGKVGTSFSTPRVSAIAAGLDAMISEKFNPLLLKALIIHSAKYPPEMKVAIAEKIDTAGFGLPSNVNEILFNQPNEITLILQDTLERGNFIDILDFPFPPSMVDEEGYHYGEVTVTLVTAPILEVSQGAEYCQSNIDVMFGSYDEKVARDTSKATIKNPIGADGRQNVLSTAVYSKKASHDVTTAFASERMLVSYGDKYQPVKKWCVNFDDFTNANKEKYLKGPKNWYLKLEGLFRHFTETKCEAQKITPSHEFCLVITIKDTKKRGNIYNEVTHLLDNFSFVHTNVKLKEEVRVRLNQ